MSSQIWHVILITADYFITHQVILITLHQQWQWQFQDEYQDATFETLHSSHLACGASPHDDPHTMPHGESWTWLWCPDSSTRHWELKPLDLQIPDQTSRSRSRVGTPKCLKPWVSAADWNLWRWGIDPYQTPLRTAYKSCLWNLKVLAWQLSVTKLGSRTVEFEALKMLQGYQHNQQNGKRQNWTLDLISSLSWNVFQFYQWCSSGPPSIPTIIQPWTLSLNMRFNRHGRELVKSESGGESQRTTQKKTQAKAEIWQGAAT